MRWGKRSRPSTDHPLDLPLSPDTLQTPPLSSAADRRQYSVWYKSGSRAMKGMFIMMVGGRGIDVSEDQICDMIRLKIMLAEGDIADEIRIKRVC